MNRVAQFEDFLNEMELNDPILILTRANKMELQKQKEAAKLRASKRVYGKKREKLEDELWEISLEIKELYRDRSQTFRDQDAEAGIKGEEWSDEDASEFGEKLNKIDEEIAKLLQKLKFEILQNLTILGGKYKNS
jgi:hypothetical protein